MLYKNYIWDFDGTLVDSYPHILASMNKVLAEEGIEPDDDVLMRHFLVNFDSAKKYTGLSDEAFNRFGRYQLMMGDDEIEPKVKPFPGVREILGGVVEMGGKNFLYTHRGGSATAYLESFGMKDFFTGIVTSRDGFPDKPAPDAILKIIKDYSLNPAECVMIGDREIDGMAGKNAGIAGFLVTSQTVDPDGNDPHAITAMDHNCHNIYGVARIAGIPRI